MRTIIVLSREYSDKSGYKVLKAYSKEKEEEARYDMQMNQELNSDHDFRLTEIPISE